jgi:Putative beta barrel porin-7 (BBP7)
MNRARLSLVLLVVGATAATAPAQYSYPGYPNYGPQPPMNGAFPAFGMPVNPAPIVPNSMVSSGAFVATPPPAANGFSTPACAQDPLVEPPYIPHVWGGVEYMLMWVRSAPRPVALLTYGSDADAPAGALGQPGTMIVEGGDHTNLDNLTAVRVSAGMWLDYDRCVGIEGSGFSTDNVTRRSSIHSDFTGNPGIYAPNFSAALGSEQATVIADPAAGVFGSATVASTFKFDGAELNGVLNLARTENCEVNFLAGVRYLRLAEGLNIDSSSSNPAADLTTTRFDGFSTRNEFYGGQLGGRVSFRNDRIFLDTTAKVAVGPTYQTVNVAGNTEQITASTGTLIGSTAGGLFTGPTNIRQQNHNDISVVPEVQMKLGLNLSSNLTVFAAYDFLYWNEVVRPGDQMSHFSPQLPIFSRTDFWAQGVTFGMEIKF